MSGIPGPLMPDASFRCKRSTGQAGPRNGKQMIEVTMGLEKLEAILLLPCSMQAKPGLETYLTSFTCNAMIKL